ncbi:hypothetical protein C370_05531, partial [Cryptococcus neoformans A1-35-8]
MSEPFEYEKLLSMDTGLFDVDVVDQEPTYAPGPSNSGSRKKKFFNPKLSIPNSPPAPVTKSTTMKLLLVASALAAVIYVQAQSEPLSQCVLNCMAQTAEIVETLPRKPATVSTNIIPFYNFREAACGTLADDIDYEGFIPSNGNSTYDKANGTSSAAQSGSASASAAATTSAPATADAASSSAAAFATVNM